MERGAIMALSSPTLLAEVIATRKATFMERRERGQEASSSKGAFIKEIRNRLRSHWGTTG